MSAEARGFEAALRDLAAVLESGGIAWYLFGAHAVVVHGRPRATADIDVTVDFELERWPELLGALRDRGFAGRIEDLEAFVLRTRVLPLAHEESGIPVDVVLAGPAGLEREFLSRAETVDLHGFAVRVISPEDLIVSKLLAGRPKDLEDVRGVLAERADRLDLVLVRRLLGALEQALDRRDLLAELERLVSRT